MTPTRLPRPGEVTERCRLCAAPLDLSVENPRRVCAKCGEINLPIEQSGSGLGPTIGSQLRGLWDRSRNERIQFFVSAVPTALAVPAFFQFLLGSLKGHGNNLLLELALALGVVLAITGVPALALGKSRNMSAPPAVMFWTFGLLVGGYGGFWLMIALQYLLLVLS